MSSRRSTPSAASSSTVSAVAEGAGHRLVRHQRQVGPARRDRRHARRRCRWSSAYLAVRRPVVGQSSASACSGSSARSPPLHRPGETGCGGAAAADRRSGRHARCSVWLPASDAAEPRIETPGPSRVPLGWDRRRFLVSTGAAAAAAVVAGGLARALERRRIESIRDAIPDTLPPVRRRAAAARSRSRPTRRSARSRRSSHRTATSTASTPRCRSRGSTCRAGRSTIGGMVDTPLTLTYDDLLARPQVERIVTLCCVRTRSAATYRQRHRGRV